MNVITGGTGSVGMHLVREWLAQGETVRLLVRPSANRTRLRDFLAAGLPADPDAFDRIEWAEGDVTDGASLEDAFEGAHRVVHAAAVVSFNRRDAGQMLAANREGTANVVNAMLATGVEELVYISSVAALGRKPGEPVVHEEAVFEDGPDVSDYARSKYRAELEVWRGQEEGLRVTILNPVIVIGPGDYNRSSAALLTQVANGLRFYPIGSNGFVAADDVAAAAWQLVAKGCWGERFIACGFHATYHELFTAMADSLGVRPPRWPVQRWVAEVAWRLARLAEIATGRPAFVTREALRTSARDHRYSTVKIQQRLDFKFTPLGPTVERAAAHYLRSRTGA
jgi:nucleoside-diphosphate-sugar epimerase